MKSYDAVVIGAGPGGYVCAIRLAQLGKKTAIIEKEKIGGVCLNVGCIPSKALIFGATQFHRAQHDFEEIGIGFKSLDCDLSKLQNWKDGVVKKLTGGVTQLLKMNQVDVLTGTASFKDGRTIEVKGKSNETVTAASFVIATGSRVVEIPTLPFNHKNILDSTETLELKTLPKKLIVVGGGFIGVEIGMAYAKLGSEVTIVEAMAEILPGTDRELVSVVEKKMRKMGITVLTQAKAMGSRQLNQGSEVELEIEMGGKKEMKTANRILVSVGRRPNSDQIGLEKLGMKLDPKGNVIVDSQGKTSVSGIFAIGDITGPPQLAHRASMDGLIVAAVIGGENAHKDYKVVPWAIFSDPEIATVGLTEKEAQAKGIKFKIGKFPFAASGRALSTNETEGMVKVLIDESNESILGVHMVGPEVSNLIAEAALAIEMGACVEDIIRTIHTHPTLPEAFPEAIESAFGKSIHIFKPPAKPK